MLTGTQADRQIYKPTDRQAYKQKDMNANRHLGIQTHRQECKQTVRHEEKNRLKDRRTNRWAYKQKARHSNRWTYKQTNRLTVIQIYKRTDRHTNKQTTSIALKLWMNCLLFKLISKLSIGYITDWLNLILWCYSIATYKLKNPTFCLILEETGLGH